jgi:hypothetical protein
VPKALLADFRKAILDTHEALLTPEDRLPASTTYDKAFRLTENLWMLNDLIKTHVLSQRYSGMNELFCLMYYFNILFDNTCISSYRSKAAWMPGREGLP